MDREYSGRVAIITGGASGIGEATARALAKARAAVLIADVRADMAEAVAKDIVSSGGRALAMPCDVSTEDEVIASVDRAVSTFGSLDFALNCAGVTGTGKTIADYTTSDWDSLMGVNLRGVFLCMKYQIRQMLRQSRGGAIVNVSSVAGLVGRAGSSAYVASKHGVIGLTKAAALEYAKDNIRVNAICPGMIGTPMVERFARADPMAHAVEIAKQAMPRLGLPDEIASAMLWLCSAGGGFTTGQALAIDGGYVAQ